MSFSFRSNILPKNDLSPKPRRQLERVLGGAVSVRSALRTQGGLLFIQPLVCWLSDTILRILGTGQPVLWLPNKRGQLALKSAQLPKQLHSSGDHGLGLVVILTVCFGCYTGSNSYFFLTNYSYFRMSIDSHYPLLLFCISFDCQGDIENDSCK